MRDSIKTVFAAPRHSFIGAWSMHFEISRGSFAGRKKRVFFSRTNRFAINAVAFIADRSDRGKGDSSHDGREPNEK